MLWVESQVKNIFTLELVYSFFLAKTELAEQKRSMLINVSDQKSFEREKFLLERAAKQQVYLQLIEHLVTNEQKAFLSNFDKRYIFHILMCLENT